MFDLKKKKQKNNHGDIINNKSEHRLFNKLYSRGGDGNVFLRY